MVRAFIRVNICKIYVWKSETIVENNAVDYLLKPIDYRDLQFAVNKIKTNLEKDKNNIDITTLIKTILLDHTKKISINSKSGVESIEATDIVCLESTSNYTHIYLADSKTILTSKTLKVFDILLCQPDMNFMRVHNSFVINLHKVLRYLKEQENIVMINNQVIQLTKSRRDIFFECLQI